MVSPTFGFVFETVFVRLKSASRTRTEKFWVSSSPLSKPLFGVESVSGTSLEAISDLFTKVPGAITFAK